MAVPALTEETRPDELTVATPALLLLQVPPVTVSPKLVFAPVQMDVIPVSGVGAVATLTVVVAKQPVPSRYEITDVPTATPVTIPVLPPAVAIPVLRLVQVPPEVPSLSVIDCPAHTAPGPVIATGFGKMYNSSANVVSLNPDDTQVSAQRKKISEVTVAV